MMAKKFKAPTDKTGRHVVVAGDVCIDWLSCPVDPVPSEPNRLNWQLRGGRYMYARRGGAWLTADLVEAALGGTATVAKPEARDNLAAVPPSELVHSVINLDRVARGGTTIWGVKSYEGFAGPAGGAFTRRLPKTDPDRRNASAVVLDDAGNDFRRDENLWPAALVAGHPLVIHKVRRPLQAGILWEYLKRTHLTRTVVVLSVDDLREEGASISRRLSWERTSAELLTALGHGERFASLRACPHLVVPLGLEGAVYIRDGGKLGATLWYLADLIEGDLLATGGGMTGLASVFAAALAAKIAAAPVKAALTPEIIGSGIKAGMIAALNLRDFGFGPCLEGAIGPCEPQYPIAAVFSRESTGLDICKADLPPFPAELDTDAVLKFRDWRLLDVSRDVPIRTLAASVATDGLDKVLPTVPVARFGGFETIDRWEIESYRAISNLIHEFTKNPSPERPLCLAVFGRPGSGKSFGVTQVAKSAGAHDSVEKLDFNVSQWDSPGELPVALHRVRDSALRGKTPLVFFDEFDASLRGETLGWLKYFLTPMQDGLFSDGHLTHVLGRAIFVFAGGTSATFQEFGTRKATLTNKLPDFLSRLRGFVNVFGCDPAVDAAVLRRAMLLRAILKRKHKRLFDRRDRLRIDEGVLAAMLTVPAFRHGIRSIEAIIEMSHLTGRDAFDPSLLPSASQIDIHVDGEAFARILRAPLALAALIEELAEKIHEVYRKALLEKARTAKAKALINARPGSKPWADLAEVYRDSNRDQAAHIPLKLAAIRATLVPGANKTFKLRPAEIKLLARMEHERWVEERRFKQPDHPALVPWKGLSRADREKDELAASSLPSLLASVGYGIERKK